MIEEAIDEFEKVLRIDPNHVNANKYLTAAKQKVKYERLSWSLTLF